MLDMVRVAASVVELVAVLTPQSLQTAPWWRSETCRTASSPCTGTWCSTATAPSQDMTSSTRTNQVRAVKKHSDVGPLKPAPIPKLSCTGWESGLTLQSPSPIPHSRRTAGSLLLFISSHSMDCEVVIQEIEIQEVEI